ncbi:MAG: amidohydrolase family protein [Planctomycetes bacterium]|nr:amidohydrolase family protein [Planctomycetota bacterium]
MEYIARAKWWVVSADRVIEDGAVLVRRGQVARVFRSHNAAARTARCCRWVDFGDAIVAPGLVNAHAHLELSGLASQTPRGGDFARWVRAVIEARASRTFERLVRDVCAGAARALESGTTTIVDVDSTGAAPVALRSSPLRVVHMREALDAQDPQRTAPALARLRQALPKTQRSAEGLSPHAPFSVSPALFAALGALAKRRDLPVQMHWSETQAEIDWLLEGRGPLAALLGSSPRRSGLELLERAGLFERNLSLVHGNFPRRGEPQSLARRGVTLVHCPGSHAWFERAPFPFARYAAAGVRVALGTDSLASNEDLDMRRELRLAASAHARWGARELWRAATEHGAAAIGRAGRIGVLERGACADWIVLPERVRGERAVLDALCASTRAIEQTWIAGRRVLAGAGLENGPRTSLGGSGPSRGRARWRAAR